MKLQGRRKRKAGNIGIARHPYAAKYIPIGCVGDDEVSRETAVTTTHPGEHSTHTNKHRRALAVIRIELKA